MERSLLNFEDIPNDKEKDDLDNYFDNVPKLEGLYDKRYEKLERKGNEALPPPEPKTLSEGLKYEYLDKEKKKPIIVNDDLSLEQSNKLLAVLRQQHEAFAYALSDVKGIDPSIVTHKIPMVEDSKPFVDTQRRLNPRMKEEVRKEVIRLLDAGVIYPISDSKWVSPAHCIPKQGSLTVIQNDEDELIPVRTVTGYKMCIDFRKINKDTFKDHKPLPFMEQILERLSNNSYFCFLDGYSGYSQIAIQPEDQEKTTFTCPYGTYAYKLMPFGLSNAATTFQECVFKIFDNLVEKTMEILMDDFVVYGTTFENCLYNLNKVLQRCKDTNLVLNWERCRFMVREGIVFGHKVSEKGIEIDDSRTEALQRLPRPQDIKGLRNFLGHAGFYKHFIKDFDKTSIPLTNLLEKDIPFSFDNECVAAFECLKKALVSAPIIQSPKWDEPFEIMCDASDYAIGAILGQRDGINLNVVHYASRTLNEDQKNYATTEREFLAVVFACDKFRPYIITSKIVVHTDHQALRHLLAKKDAKPCLIR